MNNNTIHILSVITAAVVLTLAGGCKKEPASQSAKPDPQSVPIGRVIPSGPVRAEPAATAQLGQSAAKLDGLKWIKGQPVTFQPGKVYIVEFWATWCGPCRRSIPHLTEIQTQYKDKGVTVIGITREADELEKVKKFVADQGDKMDYSVAVDPGGDVSKGYMEAYGQQYIPTAFIVDGAGKVAWYGSPMEDMEDVLKQVTAGTFDAAAYAEAKTKREALERQVGVLIRDYMDALKADKPVEQTRPMAEKLIEVGLADALNELAWYLLTDIEEGRRDYPTILKMAEKANTLTEGKNAAYLDTYALALFKNNKISEAVAAQTKAVELAGDNKAMLDELQGRLDEFKAALAK